jgi:hypothetical protein
MFGTFALTCVILAGCIGPSGDGRIEVSDLRAHEQCFEKAFPLEPTFFAARERIDSVGLFLQNRAGPEQDADGIYLEVYDVQSARANPAADLSIDYPVTRRTPVRGEVTVASACPSLNASFVIRGQVQFDALSAQKGERVQGELVSGEVVDARSGDVVAGDITGIWSFQVRTGSPWQFYPSPRDDYPTSP